MNKIQPCLSFHDEAERAVAFYVSVFGKGSKVLAKTRYGAAAAKATGRPEGSVMTVEFQLAGQRFVALNGGPAAKFSPALSLSIECRDQKEVDALWAKLGRGGEHLPCGWVKDKFGLFWQVVPKGLMKMHADKDPKKRERVMAAMLTMKKLDLAALKRAYAGR